MAKGLEEEALWDRTLERKLLVTVGHGQRWYSILQNLKWTSVEVEGLQVIPPFAELLKLSRTEKRALVYGVTACIFREECAKVWGRGRGGGKASFEHVRWNVCRKG